MSGDPCRLARRLMARPRLGPASSTWLRRHLAACDDCRTLGGEADELLRALHTAPRPRLPARLLGRLENVAAEVGACHRLGPELARVHDGIAPSPPLVAHFAECRPCRETRAVLAARPSRPALPAGLARSLAAIPHRRRPLPAALAFVTHEPRQLRAVAFLCAVVAFSLVSVARPWIDDAVVRGRGAAATWSHDARQWVEHRSDALGHQVYERIRTLLATEEPKGEAA